MLGLVAAQLEFKAKDKGCRPVKPTWVDVGSVELCRKGYACVPFSY